MNNEGFAKRPDAQRILMAKAMEIWSNKEDVVFIDVRTAEEYHAGHIPGAILIPLDELETRISEIPHDKKALFICHSGYRSHKANLIAQNHGLANTVMVEGGMLDWRAEVE